ncbi:unnamed protein product [Durusdinium trenchii]|uniref:Glycosyltransferase 2-like domain-containing protein n=1 Tax=Durusdinium trenchii TaxID=1381693 RepID=A0ABP0NT77_9DINO
MWARLHDIERITNGLVNAADLQRRPFGRSSRISVICPTTEERVLYHPQLYNCFAAQSWQDKELVVVDTGCRASPFLRNKMLEDQRLVYVHFKVAATEWPVGLKRNIAIILATGAFIAHFDDDDLYSPQYLDVMLQGLQDAQGITLASWFVWDACCGKVAKVAPKADGSQDSWLLGYGFSYVYRRCVALAQPFPHCHFGEDFHFLSGLRDRGRIRTLHDKNGHVLHVQQGMNLSNSHGQEIPINEVAKMPVAEVPGFPPLLRLELESSYISVGLVGWRPPPLLHLSSMRQSLQKMGVQLKSEGSSELEEGSVLVSYCVRRGPQVFVEPGRLYAAEERFTTGTPDGAWQRSRLPADVAKRCCAEVVALRRVACQWLSRCPPQSWALEEFEGFLLLQSRYASHMALLAAVWRMSSLFPRVRIEFDIEREDPEYAVATQAFEQQRRALQHFLVHR